MTTKLNDLRHERGEVVAEARKLLDRADAEKRSSLSADDEAKYNELMDKQDELRKSIQREERQIELDRELAGKIAQEEKAERHSESKAELEMRGLGGFIRDGERGMTEEFRNLQQGVNTKGGYLVPEQFSAQLLKDLDDSVFMRQLATVLPTLTTGASIGVPTLDTDPGDADWTSEIATVTEDTDMTLGKRELSPELCSKLIKVSDRLIRTAALSPEQIVRERLAYKFSITEEKAFLNGNGAGQPLGIFTASNDGISTSRDISTGNQATSITFDGLMEAKYGVKSGYASNGSWLFHRDAVKQISKLKDGNGQYIWQQSVQVDGPDTILGRPVYESEYAPNTFTTGQYVGMFGDFSYYWIVDSMMMEVQRLNELYAASNQVGFIGRKETDGMPALEAAFSRVTLA